MMDGWDWFWMIPMMLLWVIGLGLVIYVALRLTIYHRPPQAKT